MAAADDIREAIQDLILPELRDLNSRMASLEGRMASLDGRLDGVEARIESVRAEMQADLRRIDERLDIALELRERIIALEVRAGG